MTGYSKHPDTNRKFQAKNCPFDSPNSWIESCVQSNISVIDLITILLEKLFNYIYKWYSVSLSSHILVSRSKEVPIQLFKSINLNI